MKTAGSYIYSEEDRQALEGPFVVEQCKWCRSIKKRATAIRRLFFRPAARMRERIIEYPLVLAAMSRLASPSRVGDFGGASSLLGLQIVSLGHEVHVLDLRSCPLRHPRLFSRQMDAFDNDLEDDFFDAISCISVIEHVGIERYGGQARPQGDMQLMAELGRLVRPGGMVVVSAPYGRGHDPAIQGKPTGYRIYDRERLGSLVAGFNVDSLQFFVMEQGCWVEVDQAKADEVSTSRPIDAIFFARLGVTREG